MKSILILFSVLLLSTQTFGSDYHSPRTASLGGAGHAGPLSNDSIYLNPSYASFMRTYSIAGGYSAFNGESYGGRNLHASILDGRSPLFQAGLGYTVVNDGAWVHLGASKSFQQRFSFGAGGKLMLENGKPTHRELMLSSTYIVNESLQLSMTIDNILEEEENLVRNLQREFIIGSKILVNGSIVLYIDPHYTPKLDAQQRWGLETGAEFTAFKDLFLRAGYFTKSKVPYAESNGRGFGLGLGWISQRLSVDYAYQKVMENLAGLPPSFSHTLGMTIYF